ncbi:hypothetical protein H4219_002913 [Mycoemilia scoparia]|uniref:HpcH/HpaI aldolase/citrate lyase domain-containing protein n=1 Tax=Mycoemilia scoparia TaxID=417184 RepID=A0A9W8A053_9FUNG|nr:hypothetical protein H4219_002913 [Mycoemilia scoparia]
MDRKNDIRLPPISSITAGGGPQQPGTAMAPSLAIKSAVASKGTTSGVPISTAISSSPTTSMHIESPSIVQPEFSQQHVHYHHHHHQQQQQHNVPVAAAAAAPVGSRRGPGRPRNFISGLFQDTGEMANNSHRLVQCKACLRNRNMAAHLCTKLPARTDVLSKHVSSCPYISDADKAMAMNPAGNNGGGGSTGSPPGSRKRTPSKQQHQSHSASSSSSRLHYPLSSSADTSSPLQQSLPQPPPIHNTSASSPMAPNTTVPMATTSHYLHHEPSANSTASTSSSSAIPQILESAAFSLPIPVNMAATTTATATSRRSSDSEGCHGGGANCRLSLPAMGGGIQCSSPPNPEPYPTNTSLPGMTPSTMASQPAGISSSTAGSGGSLSIRYHHHALPSASTASSSGTVSASQQSRTHYQGHHGGAHHNYQQHHFHPYPSPNAAVGTGGGLVRRRSNPFTTGNNASSTSPARASASFPHLSSHPRTQTPSATANRLRSKIMASQVGYGAWLTIPNVACAKTIVEMGFDWACIDMTRPQFPVSTLNEMVSSISRTASACTPLVRVPIPSRQWVTCALDSGAEGIILSGVKNSGMIEEVASVCALYGRLSKAQQTGYHHHMSPNMSSTPPPHHSTSPSLRSYPHSTSPVPISEPKISDLTSPFARSFNIRRSQHPPSLTLSSSSVPSSSAPPTSCSAINAAASPSNTPQSSHSSAFERRSQNRDILLLAEVDAIDMVPYLPDILNTREVDGVFIDSRALRRSMGLDPNLDGFEPEFLTAVYQIRDIAIDRSLFVGIYTREGQAARNMAEREFNMVVAADDANTLFSSVAQNLGRAKSPSSTSTTGSPQMPPFSRM